MKGFKVVDVKGLPRFFGGFVGYMGYDMVRFFEEIPDKNPDDLKLPDSVFILTDNILIFDHVNHTIKIVANVILPRKKRGISVAQKIRIYRQAIKKIEAINKELSRPVTSELKDVKAKLKVKVTSNFKRSEFQDIVKKAKAYIKKGDIIQAVLSQRFKARMRRTPFDIYRSLRSLNPSPYMFFLKLKDALLIGSSPEMLVRCEDGLIHTRPIAGTRARGRTEKEDKILEIGKLYAAN
jgi:anthranilate synthase component 1